MSPLFIEVHMPSQENERPYTCLLVVSIMSRFLRMFSKIATGLFSTVFFVSRFINTVYDYDRMYAVSIHTAMNSNTGRLNQHKYVQHNTKIL